MPRASRGERNRSTRDSMACEMRPDRASAGLRAGVRSCAAAEANGIQPPQGGETMSKLRTLTVAVSTLSFAAPALLAQNSQNPANEHNCPSTQAIPPVVGTGSASLSPNQSLCLPLLAPTPTGLSPLAFIVQGVEPGDRVDAQGTAYVVSIRGVPGGVDLWRWYSTRDGSPKSNQTLPFKY